MISTESGKIILKMSVEHVIHHDYIDQEKKKMINELNATLAQNFDDENFQIENERVTGTTGHGILQTSMLRMTTTRA
jgi:hypothetical protein